MKVILGRKKLGPWGPKMLRYNGKSPRWSGKSYQLTSRLSMTIQESWFLMVRHGKTTCIPLEDPTTLLVTNTIYLWYFGRAVVCGSLTSCGLAVAKRLVTLLSLFRNHLAKRWTSSIFVSSAQRKQHPIPGVGVLASDAVIPKTIFRENGLGRSLGRSSQGNNFCHKDLGEATYYVYISLTYVFVFPRCMYFIYIDKYIHIYILFIYLYYLFIYIYIIW